MGTVSPKRRLEIIERDVLPSIFVGVLSKDAQWFEHTKNETLPQLEERAYSLARACRKSGECKEDDPLIDETRIRALFEDARMKLEREHQSRRSRSRIAH